MKMRKNSGCFMVKDEHGNVLKVFDEYFPCRNWIKKHYPDKLDRMHVKQYRGKADVCAEFDRQMSLGLTDTDVIACMLWYGGISRTKDIDANGHFIGPERARKAMNRK